MSKKLFTPQEIEQLKQNEYVKSVSEKGITYTKEFEMVPMSRTHLKKGPRNQKNNRISSENTSHSPYVTGVLLETLVC